MTVKVAQRESALAFAAGMTAVILWASAFVGIRSARHEFTAGPLTLGRLVVGTLSLGALMVIRREHLPRRADWPGVVVCGVLWFGIYNLALNEGERKVDAGTAAMLVNVGPILIAIFAGLILGEGFPRSLFTGVAVAFVGVVIIAIATSTNGIEGGWGAVLCLIAAVTYAGGVIAQKPLLKTMTPLQVTWGACAVGMLVALPWAGSLVSQVKDSSDSGIAWLVYLGVFPTAIGFTAWAYALARNTAGRMGSLTYLVPPLVIVMSWAILSETPPAFAILGGGLCLAGVAVSRR